MPDMDLNQSKTKLVAGHLREKNNLYYIVLNLKGLDKKGNLVRKPKWIPTGLTVKGNKKRAEVMLQDARLEYSAKEEITVPVPKQQKADDLINDRKKKISKAAEGKESKNISSQNGKDVLFADYLEYYWLGIVKNQVELSTYCGYANNCKKVICPYFRELGVTLTSLTADDIEMFYVAQSMRPARNRKTADGSPALIKPSTIIHYHAIIHKALKYARKKNKIDKNPMDTVDTPRFDDYVGDSYSIEEANQMLELAKGTKIEAAVIFAAFYGLRRSEVVGLKWDAIDFTNDTFIIKRTVTEAYDGEQKFLIEKEKTKNKSSRRTMLLVGSIKTRLQEIKAKQEYHQKLCGNSYNKKYLGYIFVDELGNLIKPDYITSSFRGFLERQLY